MFHACVDTVWLRRLILDPNRLLKTMEKERVVVVGKEEVVRLRLNQKLLVLYLENVKCELVYNQNYIVSFIAIQR